MCVFQCNLIYGSSRFVNKIRDHLHAMFILIMIVKGKGKWLNAFYYTVGVVLVSCRNSKAMIIDEFYAGGHCRPNSKADS